LTGIGLKVSNSIIDIVGGNIYLLLVLTAVVTLLIGGPLPASITYILLIPLVIPDLPKIDEDMMLVSTEFHIQPFLAQFSAVTDVFQAARIISENAEVSLIIVQSEARFRP
jgi:TRAP-type uncharacterized transport system fused permease subunit